MAEFVVFKLYWPILQRCRASWHIPSLLSCYQ